VTLVKICGITRPEDITLCAREDADMVGLIVEVARSPRSVALDRAAALAHLSALRVVALLEHPSPARAAEVAERLGAYAVQLVGGESLEAVRSVGRSLAGVRAGAVEAAPTHPLLFVTIGVPPAGTGCDVGRLQAQAAAVADAGADALVVDTAAPGPGDEPALAGGTGATCDWAAARAVVEASPVPVWLAGGLDPGNALSAIRQVGPAGLDVSSGVEAHPGAKDEHLVRDLIWAVREADRW
jgi:phosphoribosylanthranilate isomerase